MSAFITDLDTVKARAQARHDDFEVMRYQLQGDDDLNDARIDKLVDMIAAPIVAAIDCTTCANCCRHLEVQLGEDDIIRLAEGLGISHQQAEAQIAMQPMNDPDIIGTFAAKPCPFLDGKLCRVYAHRPTACRDYPQFTPDFRWMLNWMIAGAHLCPIIYHVLVAMCDQTDALQRGEL